MKIKISVWSLLITPPIFFLISLITLMVFEIDSYLTESQISNKIENGIPFVLLSVQLFMCLVLFGYAKQNNKKLILATFASRNTVKEVVWGVILGITIALIYFKCGLLELVTYLQSNVGDYVPAGGTNSSLGKNMVIFFIANVLFAPFVEEHIYRNIAFNFFLKTRNRFATVLITAVFFGLLHWLGGVWYIVATTVLIGIPFGIIQLKRNNILLVFCAHFSLNLMEFLFQFNL